MTASGVSGERRFFVRLDRRPIVGREGTLGENGCMSQVMLDRAAFRGAFRIRGIPMSKRLVRTGGE